MPIDPQTKSLETIREIGFDNTFHVGRGHTEVVFFLGPHMLDGRERSDHATEEALLDFIDYWENQIQVAKDYLANDRDSNTHSWIRRGT
jgi:hypothetical protein